MQVCSFWTGNERIKESKNVEEIGTYARAVIREEYVELKDRMLAEKAM